MVERTGKKVLLFSSGMDSFIINKLEKPDVLLFIDNKSNYSDIEMKYLESVGYDNLIFVEDFIDHSKIELPNMIIPSRNLYFAMIAANFGEEIILGATLGDRSTDKDKKFAKLASKLLTHIYNSHWNTKGEIHVNLKYKDYTKQDLVTEYMAQQRLLDRTAIEVVQDLLIESFSCYHPLEDGRQCNRCKPDLRKFLAILGATGINIDRYYEEGNRPGEFFTNDVINEWIKDLSKDQSRGRESLETIEVLKTLKK